MKLTLLVRQFHKLFREFLFDLFGLINLEILNLQFGSSTEFQRRFKFELIDLLDNVEIPDRWGPLVSDSTENGSHAGNV